jgi:hypothetical protein
MFLSFHRCETMVLETPAVTALPLKDLCGCRYSQWMYRFFQGGNLPDAKTALRKSWHISRYRQQGRRTNEGKCFLSFTAVTLPLRIKVAMAGADLFDQQRNWQRTFTHRIAARHCFGSARSRWESAFAISTSLIVATASRAS